MKNKDVELLSEAYEQIYNEGAWDKTKYYAARAGGAVKGLGQRAQAAGQGVGAAWHAATGNQEKANQLWNKSQANIKGAKQATNQAGLESIFKSKAHAIVALAKDIIKDVNDLGLNKAVPGQGPTITVENLTKGMMSYLRHMLGLQVTQQPAAPQTQQPAANTPEAATQEVTTPTTHPDGEPLA